MTRLVWIALIAALPALSEDVAVRIRFGLTDTAPQKWDGSLTAQSGQVRAVRNWNPHPSESVQGTAWKLGTRKGQNYPRRAYQKENPAGTQPYLYHPGVVVHLDANSSTRLDITTPRGRFTIPAGTLAAARLYPYLDGAVLVDRVASAEQVSAPEFENDFAAIAATPNGEIWTAWTAYQKNTTTVMTRRWSAGRWDAPVAIAKPGDIYRVQLVHARGRLWAVWSEQVNGNFDLYAQSWDGRGWSTAERLTTAPQSDVEHVLTADAGGNVWLAWQGFRDGKADIFARTWNGSAWSPEQRVSTSPANDWSPAIAADANGAVTIAWDTYDKGNYDVMARTFSAGQWGAIQPLAATPKFEAHVRIAYDGRNRLWAAWNESGFEWGKDTGFLIIKEGTRLYDWRSLEVAVFDGGRRQNPVADFNQSLPADLRDSNDLPQLQRDGAGRMWVFFRHRDLKARDTPSFTAAHRAVWEIYGSAYDGDRWTTPIHAPYSRGRQDVRYGITADSRGTLWGAWPTDTRDADDYLFRKAEVFAGAFPRLEGAAGEPQLAAHAGRAYQTYPIHPAEAEDTARIRGYTIESAGKTYRIYRGDTHRHTEFSADGMFDGSLIETYRYAIDAASLDFLGVSDHAGQGGQEVEYINWLLPQIADIFHLPRSFTTIFTYERGVSYPNGHRNILTARRGIPALPIPQSEAQGRTGAAELYRYLRQNAAIAISHTSATGMGTDWRDNDPDVEPLVEMFQGDRVSAEYEGAPKTASAARPQSQQGGLKPLGYIWNAWAKGYKLGVQASSDHLSTHISYACTIAEDPSREGLLDAMRKRHSYGATDNIVLDYRLQTGGREYIQGDIIDNAAAVRLWVKVLGTAPIRQIDVIRNNQFIHTIQRLDQTTQFTFEDAQPLPGESYYYVRVQQADEEMAWSSPIWVRRAR